MPYNGNSDNEYKITDMKEGRAGGFLGGHHTDKQLREAIEEHDKRAFDMLSVLGVPKERARTVENGIEVLSTRYRKERHGYEYNINVAIQAGHRSGRKSRQTEIDKLQKVLKKISQIDWSHTKESDLVKLNYCIVWAERAMKD